MTGNVVLKKGKDVMQRHQLTVNLDTGQATLGGGVKTTAQTASQVAAACRAYSRPTRN